MKKQIFSSLLAVFLVSSCISSQGIKSPDEAIQPTQVSAEETVQFPDLEGVLIQENDLPAGYSAGSTSHKFSTYYEKILVPDADYVMRQQIQRDSVSGGQVTVFDYALAGMATFAFNSITADMKNVRDLEGVGEKAMLEIPSDDQSVSQDYVGIVFVQCHAAVHISVLGTNDEQAVIAYAERLAQRLEPLVCE